MDHYVPRQQSDFRKAHCLLRGITTDDPFWTYCDHFTEGWMIRLANAQSIRIATSRTPTAAEIAAWMHIILEDHARHGTSFTPVFASGLYEGGYTRIPWDGPIAPNSHGGAGTCDGCRSTEEHTIVIEPADTKAMRFCSNRCYLRWWVARDPLRLGASYAWIGRIAGLMDPPRTD